MFFGGELHFEVSPDRPRHAFNTRRSHQLKANWSPSLKLHRVSLIFDDNLGRKPQPKDFNQVPTVSSHRSQLQSIATAVVVGRTISWTHSRPLYLIAFMPSSALRYFPGMIVIMGIPPLSQVHISLSFSHNVPDQVVSLLIMLFSFLVSDAYTSWKGQELIILEAMKMEHIVTAPSAGTVETVLFVEGDLVDEGVVLVTLAPPAQ